MLLSTLLEIIAIFVLPFGGALLAGGLTVRFGALISGPTSILGLVAGIWAMSFVLSLL